ncbi:MAG: hypothetical protein JSU83_03665 [Deltaproteobacteria bacterium]|nr:MAG: hypothetical protein JSU83_03665 [Deltaproteobacteria bacterium]
MDFKTHLIDAWEMTLEFIAPLIIITLIMFVVWFLSFGILVPVTFAGYTQSILLMIRQGREPRIQDLFSQLNLFLPLLGFGIMVCAATVIGLIFFVLPGLLIALATVFICLYVVPLMIDKNLGLFDAIKKSYSLALQGALVDHLVVVIIFIGIHAVGSSVFIGSLFTQPLATIFLLSVYEKKTNLDSASGGALSD